MGTSVNQRSPNTGGWRSVSACYTNENVSVDRTALEVWRAAGTQDETIAEQLGSEVVAHCAAAASRPMSQDKAVAEVERLTNSKQNHLIGEFAKQALLIKAAGGHPEESFGSVLFRQITNYLVARDISGYVGSEYRCKTVQDVRGLKSNIADVVARKVQAVERREQLGSRSWDEVYPVLLRHIRA